MHCAVFTVPENTVAHAYTVICDHRANVEKGVLLLSLCGMRGCTMLRLRNWLDVSQTPPLHKSIALIFLLINDYNILCTVFCVYVCLGVKLGVSGRLSQLIGTCRHSNGCMSVFDSNSIRRTL